MCPGIDSRGAASHLPDGGKCAFLSLFPRDAVGEYQLSAIKVARGLRRKQEYPTTHSLKELLYFGEDPYVGLAWADMAFIESYGSSAVKAKDAITRAIQTHLDGPVHLIVEVGSFIGTSAVRTWGHLVENTGIVLCVDTWQGDVNMRLGSQFQKFMSLKHGHPTLYNVFLQRVFAHNLTERIFPLAMPSLTAARLLAAAQWIIDVIYVDSAHEQGETLIELHMYFNLLRPGGILLGDDWKVFPAVKHDVTLFAECVNRPVTILGDNVWMITKPTPPADDSSSIFNARGAGAQAMTRGRARGRGWRADAQGRGRRQVGG